MTVEPMQVERPGPALLPDWYAPAPMARRELLKGWRRLVVLVIVATFIAINAYGLCSTYGRVVLA